MSNTEKSLGLYVKKYGNRFSSSAYWNLYCSGGRAKRDALGIKTVRGLLHNIGMSFVQERVHPGRHMVAGSNYSKRVIRRSDMSENACRTFQGSKSVIWYLLRCLKLSVDYQRPCWYHLGCFSLNKIPEISITRTILMIWLEPLEHIDKGVFIFRIFQFFVFKLVLFRGYTSVVATPTRIRLRYLL